ncbi:MMPL family transporter [Maribacter sp.]|nr:MMPL family transporter [Maribacter sp.]
MKKAIVAIFMVLGVLAGASLLHLKFSFDFSQFFPAGDEDLIFYQEFIKDFGTDDNFLLVAVEGDSTVFDEDFLRTFDTLSNNAKSLPYVTQAVSLTTVFYPLKTGMGYIRIPVVNTADSAKYAGAWKKIQEDDIFINALVDKEATSLVLALETEDDLNYDQSKELLTAIRLRLKENGFEKYHLLGRTFFYEALIDMQKAELAFTSISSSLLVCLVLFLVYRRVWVIVITLFSILLALVLFLGLLSVLGKELTVLAAFYPILLLIVGTSDVVHIMDDYLGKLQKGLEKRLAMQQTLREVGVSTLLTSVTTAIGFASLLTSKSSSVSGFGLDAAIGVLTTFVTIIFFTCSVLLLTNEKYLLPKTKSAERWSSKLAAINGFTKKYPRPILIITLIFTGLCVFGMTRINTNYQIQDSFPKNSAIANDFKFFQENYAGFRPLEVAVSTKGRYKITDFAVAQEIEKVVQQMKAIAPIQNVQSVNALYKGVHKANNLNKSAYFSLPEEENKFFGYQKEIKKLARKQYAKYVNPDETKTRIRAKVLDVGLDTITKVYQELNHFIATQTDSAVVAFKLTGTGILLDKNSFYVKDSLIQGLLMGLILVALIMALLFKNLKLLLISLLPNLLPLLFAAALLGFLGIPLEATISVVFAIVFGIAVDDTIHFLGRYKVGITNGKTKEEAIAITFAETGRALVITTMTLFLGFMVLLFSEHMPSVTIGLLVSITLLTALVLDLLLLPVLLRKLLK